MPQNFTKSDEKVNRGFLDAEFKIESILIPFTRLVKILHSKREGLVFTFLDLYLKSLI